MALLTPASWLKGLVTFLYPAQCRICQDSLALGPRPYICDQCWEQIEFCGTQDTISNWPGCRRSRSVTFYLPILREAIFLLKYEKKQVMAKHLADLLLQHPPSDFNFADYDLYVPIPLHKKRQRQRGFNQAELILKAVAKTRFLPIRTDLLARVKNTAPLSQLTSVDERIGNISGAFQLRYPEQIKDLRILIFDDILTTGTTLKEAVRVLEQGEPEYIEILTLSKTSSTEVEPPHTY